MEQIWDEMARFAAYSFCKAHSVTYGRLAYRYLKGWFLMDLFTVLPFDTITMLSPTLFGDGCAAGSSGVLVKGIKLIRIARLFKLLRTAKRIAAFRVMRLLIQFLYVIHILACGWRAVRDDTAREHEPLSGAEDYLVHVRALCVLPRVPALWLVQVRPIQKGRHARASSRTADAY